MKRLACLLLLTLMVLAADCNFRLLMSVYGQMAELFHRQNLPQDEIEALNMSGKYDLLITTEMPSAEMLQRHIHKFTIHFKLFRIE